MDAVASPRGRWHGGGWTRSGRGVDGGVRDTAHLRPSLTGHAMNVDSTKRFQSADTI